GEPQILGQLKEQYAAAAAAGASGQILHRCFHRSFSVAKRIRRETRIAERAVSIGSAAVELSRSIFDGLEDKSALLLGAGTMGELTARQLLAQGVGSVMVANRTFERAIDVARTLGAMPVPWDRLPRYLPLADLVIAAASGEEFLLPREALERLTQAIVNKVLHAPLTALRRHRADPAEAFYVEAARRLFRLGTDLPELGPNPRSGQAPDAPPEELGEAGAERRQASRPGPGRAAEAAREVEAQGGGAARAPDGPPAGEAERESARAGRRGPGASEERSARSARAPDGPPAGEAERESARAGRRAGWWGPGPRARRRTTC